MFRSARIKLTAWYLLIIMFITLTFSGIVYNGVSIATQRALTMHETRMEARLRELGRFPRQMARFQEPISLETIQDIRSRIITILLFINLGVLTSSAILGYILAGITLKPIEEMTRKQKKFIADAAHELKTPLTAIKTDLEVNLRNKKLDIKKARTILHDTIRDVDSLTYLTNSLLKQSRVENYNNGNNFEKANIKGLLDNVVKKLRPKATKKKITIKKNYKDATIFIDKESISELFTILVDNAIKFNKNGGTVEILTNIGKENYTVLVKDSGVGIPKKDQKHIFERFYKADSSRTKNNIEGYGLGLSIAKEIVKRHKGRIIVDSQVNKGSTFKVILPK
jgi:signal transduction histidine kinase